MLRVVFVTSVFLLSLTVVSDNSDKNELISFLDSYISSKYRGIDDEKANLDILLSNTNLSEIDTIKCLAYDGKFTLLEVPIGQIDEKKVYLDKSAEGTNEKWSKRFIRKFKGTGNRHVKMSDLLQISENQYLVAFKHTGEFWVDLIWKDELGNYQICKGKHRSH